MEDILIAALRLAARRGYPTSDPEYGSAVGWGVARALDTFQSGKKHNLKSWACLLALRECRKAARLLGHWQASDRLGAELGPRVHPPPALPRPPIKLADWEILLFVAHHGRARAARLLGLRGGKLQALLDGIEARLSR